MHSIVLQDTLTLLEVVEESHHQGIQWELLKKDGLFMHIYARLYSPELNVINVALSVAISKDRPNAGLKLAVTLTVQLLNS